MMGNLNSSGDIHIYLTPLLTVKLFTPNTTVPYEICQTLLNIFSYLTNKKILIKDITLPKHVFWIQESEAIGHHLLLIFNVFLYNK